MRLLYLSPVPWASFAQRPHKFVEWWHRQYSAEVMWVEPYPARFPGWRDVSRLRRLASRSRVLPPKWLRLHQPVPLPLEPLPGIGPVFAFAWRNLMKQCGSFVTGGECVLVVGKPSRLAQQVVRAFPFHRTIYDAMDDFPAFHSGMSARVMKRCELALAAEVDTICVSSSALAEKFGPLNPDVRLVRNACDPASLSEGVRRSDPSTNAIIGYVGTIGAWFDWTLVVALARACPGTRIRLVGPVDVPCPDPLPPNIEMRPPCPHDEAMREMAGFSVGLIPFRLTPLTASVDPIKYYEYAALGVPVLTTRFGEMRHRLMCPGVFGVDHDTELAAVVSEALAWRAEPSATKQFRAENSWDSRFAAVELGRHV